MMDLKFNCYDLAGQNAEIFSMYRKMQHLSDSLADIFDRQEPQIKQYEGIQKEFTAAKAKTADLSTRILMVYNTLDQIIDQYYAAENKALRASEELPIGIILEKKAGTHETAMPIITSTIHSKELVLEDWLAALIYKNGE